MPYAAIFNVAIIVAFVLAFIKAEEIKVKIILASIMALIFILPQVVYMPPMSWLWWLHYIAKIGFGLCCVIYIKWTGMAY